MERMRMFRIGIPDVETSGAMTNPLDNAVIATAPHQDFNTIQRVGGAAAAGGRFGPFVNHGKGKTHLGGGLFGADLLKHLTQKLMGLHDRTLWRMTARLASRH